MQPDGNGGMRKRKPVVLRSIGLFMVAWWIFTDPPIYFAGSIHGKVVDATTGRPIARVPVLAEWIIYSEGIGHGGTGGPLQTLEVLTDENGVYTVPAWGPRIRPPFARLEHLSPQLIIFKSGYYPEILINDFKGASGHDRALYRTSKWDGATIRLVPFDGNWEMLYRDLSTHWSGMGSHCMDRCPQFIGQLLAVSTLIKRNAPPGSNAYPILDAGKISLGVRNVLGDALSVTPEPTVILQK